MFFFNFIIFCIQNIFFIIIIFTVTKLFYITIVSAFFLYMFINFCFCVLLFISIIAFFEIDSRLSSLKASIAEETESQIFEIQNKSTNEVIASWLANQFIEILHVRVPDQLSKKLRKDFSKKLFKECEQKFLFRFNEHLVEQFLEKLENHKSVEFLNDKDYEIFFLKLVDETFNVVLSDLEILNSIEAKKKTL